MSKCALKIDLHKAFNSLSWAFVIEALKKMNFSSQFVEWIRACITTPMYSAKINRTLRCYIKGAKNLRQGDPISPYLFSISMNVLSCLLANMLSDFKYHWKCKHLKLTYLFFADDVLLFSNGEKHSISHVMNYLSTFSRMSGLTPSTHKSTAFLVCCDGDLVSWFDSSLTIPHGALPVKFVKFLGVPLISSRLSINECIPLIDRLTSQIFAWTSLLLSFVGRT